MMHRFWKILCGSSKLTIEYKLTGESGSSKFDLTTCDCNQENMSKIYEVFKKNYDLDYKRESRFLEHCLKVGKSYKPFIFTIFGKLNGRGVNETFHDLESFRKYLEDNLLIPKITLELKPS